MIKDSGGLLTVDRVRTLVPAIRAAAGDVPVEIHSHCLTGLAPLVCLEAVKLGIDRVHTAIGPLANGASLPSAAGMIANLRTLGYRVDVADAAINDVSEHFLRVAKRTGNPIGAPVEYDAFHYKHQVPGGMLSNFHAQLRDAGMLDKLDAVLEEISRVRVDLGWLLMVTPFSQLIGVQAMLNVVTGERYKVVPDEVKRYALGHYGAPPSPIEPGRARQDRRQRVQGHSGARRAPARRRAHAPRQVSACVRRGTYFAVSVRAASCRCAHLRRADPDR